MHHSYWPGQAAKYIGCCWLADLQMTLTAGDAPRTDAVTDLILPRPFVLDRFVIPLPKLGQVAAWGAGWLCWVRPSVFQFGTGLEDTRPGTLKLNRHSTPRERRIHGRISSEGADLCC